MLLLQGKEMDTLRSLFADKCVDWTHQKPVFTFEIAGSDDTFGLFLPYAAFWNQFIVLFLLLTTAQCILATAVYYFIVQRRPLRIFSYLMGYGVIIPLALTLPYMMIETLGLHNKVLKMATFTIPTVVVFRCLEAMHETAQDAVVESSLTNYLAYYSTAAHFEWDGKTGQRRAWTAEKLSSKLSEIVILVMVFSALLSLLLCHDFHVFPTTVKMDEFYLGWDLLAPYHILNNYVLAVLTYVLFAAGFEGMGLVAPGFYYTKPAFLDPLFSSRSPSEFWGRRWNLLIHRSLKSGVYLPLRKACSNKFIPIVLTFICSGLWHDYVWTLIFYRLDDCKRCYQPIPLKVSAFFLFNGLLVVVELTVGRYIEPITKHLPTLLISPLVLFWAMPFAHWFMGDWAVGGMFRDFTFAVWHIQKIQPPPLSLLA